MGAQRGPANHLWMGPIQRPPYHGTTGAPGTPSTPDIEVPWFTKGEVEALSIQLAQEFRIQA